MATHNENIVKVGSRKSELALIQTRYVISLLKQLYPEKEFEVVTMTTLGDRVLNISLPKIGEKSLFTKDLEEALECGRVDLVVHSLKDLPTSLPPGMAIGAVLEREDPRDALVLREDFKGHTLATLPEGSIIGTSSLRRTAQLSRNHPHLKVVDIRGNLNTRLKKLDVNCQHSNTANRSNSDPSSNGDPTSKINGNGSTSHDSEKSAESNGAGSASYDAAKYATVPDYRALILAQAGLVRMGWQHRISQVLPCKEVLYAIGQGALAIECRANNSSVLSMLAPLNHPETYCRILAERSFLKTLGGGCSAPVGISSLIKSTPKENTKLLKLTGAVWSLDGKTKIQDAITQEFQNLDETVKNNDSRTILGKHKISDGDSESISEPKISVVERRCQRNCRPQQMMHNAELVEIENFISIHGKLFCSFNDSTVGVCPYQSAIGVDFMGECPVFAAGGEGSELSERLVKLHPRRPSYDIKKCPFMLNQVVAMNVDSNVDNATTATLLSEGKGKNCPFIKQETQNRSIDVNRIGNEAEHVKEDSICSAGDVKLYCGLTKHEKLPIDVIERCEDMGKQLANLLIEEGALGVMKMAQNYIRGSFTITSSTAAASTVTQ